MKTIKEQIDAIAHRITQFSARQKMLAGVGVSAMIVGIVVWRQFAASPDMQPILNQPLSDAELAQVTARLDARGIKHTQTPDKKILVPADRKIDALADLGYTDSLPDNAQNGFDEIARQMSPWDPSSKTEKMYNRAKEVTLGNIISKFPGVKSAVVLIDPTSEQRIGESVKPSASVSLWTNDGKNAQQLASAAANMLTGAQANLERNRIRVTVDGVPCSFAADEVQLSGSAFERRQQIGRALAEKVVEHLGIPNLLVSISVQLAPRQNNPAKRPVAQPTTANLTPAETLNALLFPPASQSPAPKKPGIGHETITAASVNVPRSYFVNVFRRANPDAKEPSDAVLQSIVSAELDKIRRQVKACLGLKDASMVSVDFYADASPQLAEPSAPLAAAPVALTAHVKEIAIGALAMASLFLLSLLIKRRQSAAPPLVAFAGPHAYLPDYSPHNEDQTFQRVHALVRHDPDRAAQLVQRWLELK